ncbi:roadblock/LC7 domain-containing protein [Aurantivibrio plasticivorans]
MTVENLYLPLLRDLFGACTDGNPQVDVISLATSDGFPVLSYASNQENFKEDTMAAAASTLQSVSSAVAQQILGREFKSTFIEAKEGNVCFVALNMMDKDYVLAMSASGDMNIASLRLCINGLASEISAL